MKIENGIRGGKVLSTSFLGWNNLCENEIESIGRRVRTAIICWIIIIIIILLFEHYVLNNNLTLAVRTKDGDTILLFK